MPRGAWLALAAFLVAAGLLLAPVAPAPTTRILGNFQSEASTHAPVLAAALDGLGRHGPFLLAEHPLHPQQVRGAMYEPITTLLLAPFYVLAGGGVRGFTVAWNAWHLVVLSGTTFGAWLWARAWLGDRDPGGWGAGLAAALASASIFAHLSPEVGRTEAQNYALYALHGGLLFHAVRHGGRAWIGAALSVVPVVWSGGYGTVFFAVVEPLVALWALAIAPNRRRAVLGLAGVAVTAGLAAAPLVWALRAYPYVGTTEARTSAASAPVEVLLVGSESLLRVLPGYEVAPFAGIVTLLAAALAVVRTRAALWPLLAGLVVYAISAGPAPTVGGAAVWGPAAFFETLPEPIGVVRGWHRIVAFAIPLFAVAAAGLGARKPAVAAIVAALALAETARARVGSWWTLEEPAALVALRKDGAPIPLPIDGLERTRRWLAPPTGPDLWAAMPDHVLFRYFQDALPNEPELFRSRLTAPTATYDPCALLADAVALRAEGFGALYLRPDFLPPGGYGAATRALAAVFGPTREEGVWRLPTTVPEDCRGDGRDAIVLGGGPAVRRGPPATPEEQERLRAERQAEIERRHEERLRQKRERLERERSGR